MPSISSCPECHRDLTIPDVTDRQQSLGCPLCQARFPAERVLAESVSFPPAALVIGTDDSLALLPQAGEARGENAAEIAGEPEACEVEPATSDESAAMESAAASETASSHAWPVASLHDTGAGEDVGSTIGEATTEAADSAAALEKADSSESADYDSFGQQAATIRVAPRMRRQTSALGALGQLVGMALGGVLGLAIGYWVLVWIGGPEKDFLHLRGKVPRWLMPPRRHNDGRGAPPFASAGTGRTARHERSLADLLDDPSKVEAIPDSHEDAIEMLASNVGQAFQPDASQAGKPDLPFGSSRVLRYKGPRAFNPRTVDDLVASIDAAHRMLRCPHCKSYGGVHLAAFAAPLAADESSGDEDHSDHCDYCRGKPLVPLTAATFERLCDLAEVVTFVQFDRDDPRLDHCREAAEQVILALGAQRERSEVAGRLAGERLESSQRESNGILLAGTVEGADVEGDFFAIRLLLLGSGKPVTVLSRLPPEPPLERRDRVVVLGSIIDSPRDNLTGYLGDLTQVVWGGLPLKVASAAR